MRYPKSHLSTVVLLFVAIAIVACEPAAEQPQPAEEIYHVGRNEEGRISGMINHRRGDARRQGMH